MTIEDLNKAEIAIWKYVQTIEYDKVIDLIQHEKSLLRKIKLAKLCPFIDSDGLLRVGGRLERAIATYTVKHPIILPSDSHVVLLLVRNVHQVIGHQGRETVTSRLRQKYWIIGLSSLTRRILHDCIQCRKRQARPRDQLVADKITL